MFTERLFGRHAVIVRDRPFQLLVGANATAVIGSTLISPVLDTLTRVFSVSAAEIGLIVTVAAAPTIVLLPVAGGLADRYGRKPMLIAGLSLFGLGGTAIAFTTDFRIVLFLRFLQGVGTAGTFPVIITSLGDLYEGEREATAQGIRSSLSGVSMAFFPLVAGFLVLVAWQLPFLIFALPILAAAAIYRWLDEPAGANADPDVEPDGDGDPDMVVGPGVGAYARRLLALAAQPRVASIMVVRGIVSVAFVAFLTYNSLVVVRVLGGTAGHAGVVAALFSLSFAVAASQAGRLTEAFGTQSVPLLAANVALGVGLLAFALAPSVAIAAVGGVVLGAGEGLAFPLIRDLTTEFAPTSLRAGLVSLTESGGRFTSTVTPVVIGAAIALLETGLGTAAALQWSVAAAGGVAGLAGVLCVLVFSVAAPVRFESGAEPA